MNFDYEVSYTKLNLINSQSKDNYNIQEINLSSNVCLINHSFLHGLFEKRNYDFSKSSLKNSQSFISLENQYFMLEIRIKKPEDSISINDIEDLKECYLLIVDNISDIVELFSLCKYLVHYEEDALKNYISKYIFETINLFIRMNEHSLTFFENIGIINNDYNTLIYPLKYPVKKIRKLYYQGKLLTYFKSDNRSFFDYIKKILPLDSKGNTQTILSVEYSKYLFYKVFMDREINNSKDFKLKRYITKHFCSSIINSDLKKIPEIITESDKFLSYNNDDVLDVTKSIEKFRTLESDNSKKLQIKNKYFKEKNQIDSTSNKLLVEDLEFLNNVKIEKDGILDIDTLFEFFCKVLNKTILNDCKNNSHILKNQRNFEYDNFSNKVFEESKATNSFAFEDKNHKSSIEPQFNKQADFHNNMNNQREKFLVVSLKKSLIKYITNKGFFNIDIILNEDEFRNLKVCNCSKRINKFIGKCLYCLGNCILKLTNSLLSINEGLIHKHFSIFYLSYNFNEKNRIYTFNSKFDASKKNKLRVYDVLFDESWAEEISKLIIFLYKDFYGLKAKSNVESFTSEIDPIAEEFKNRKNFFFKNKDRTKKYENNLLIFMDKFKNCVDFITKEFFQYYNFVLPDFKSFCKNLGRFPISRYNVIDNLCQHFTNSSIQVLLNKSIMFYSRAQDIKESNKVLKSKINVINLDTPIEPYLINVDKSLKEYFNNNGYFEEFVKKNFRDTEDFINELKSLNRSNDNIKNIIKANSELDFDYLINSLQNDFKLNIEIESIINFINL